DAGELLANPVAGASRIVAQRGDQNTGAARSVAFVSDFGVMNALQLALPLLDRPLDVLFGHGCGSRRLNRSAKPRIMVGVAATELGGHRDLTNEFCELRTTLGVGRRLVMLDLLPLTMTGHNQIG